jgi:hypothetical protein
MASKSNKKGRKSCFSKNKKSMKAKQQKPGTVGYQASNLAKSIGQNTAHAAGKGVGMAASGAHAAKQSVGNAAQKVKNAAGNTAAAVGNAAQKAKNAAGNAAAAVGNEAKSGYKSGTGEAHQ